MCTREGGRYRYYTCSMKARQGPTACTGMAVPMQKLDDLVANHLQRHGLSETATRSADRQNKLTNHPSARKRTAGRTLTMIGGRVVAFLPQPATISSGNTQVSARRAQRTACHAATRRMDVGR
jgi:hypothetical protein